MTVFLTNSCVMFTVCLEYVCAVCLAEAVIIFSMTLKKKKNLKMCLKWTSFIFKTIKLYRLSWYSHILKYELFSSISFRWCQITTTGFNRKPMKENYELVFFWVFFEWWFMFLFCLLLFYVLNIYNRVQNNTTRDFRCRAIYTSTVAGLIKINAVSPSLKTVDISI